MVFVVVVLPLVLDQEQKPVTQSLSVQIPSQSESPFRSIPPPAMPSPAIESAPPVVEKPVAPKSDSTTLQPPPPRTISKEGGKAKSKEVPREAKAESRRAAALLNDLAYFVPLGAFGNPEYAKRVQDKADGAGFRSYTEKVRNPQGEQIRVRAGPFPSKEAAEKARAELKSIGLDVGQVAQR